MRLLYVEDEAWMARTVEHLLRQMGYEFDTADCGEDAINRATQNDYDLILLDIMLPDIDGYEVIERLRENGVNTPFLLQTGLIDRKKESEGASFGVTEYLIKPFNKNELVKGIETVIERAKQDRAELHLVPPDNGTVTDENGRQHRRFKTLKSARVVADDVFSCVVLNMSYSGAAIRLPSVAKQVPENFKLIFKSGDQRECELCWRHGDKIGVKFL